VFAAPGLLPVGATANRVASSYSKAARQCNKRGARNARFNRLFAHHIRGAFILVATNATRIVPGPT
jgi:hypothetical protein